MLICSGLFLVWFVRTWCCVLSILVYIQSRIRLAVNSSIQKITSTGSYQQNFSEKRLGSFP